MIRRLLDRAQRQDDDGFTLAELIVYMIILIMVLGIGATLLIQTLTMQRDVRAMADASNTAQLTFAELERDVRNASWVRIGSNGALMVMRTRIAGGGNDLPSLCVGYYLNESTGDLHRTSTSGLSDTAAALAATSTSQLEAATAGWPVTRDGISSISGDPAFGPNDGSYGNHNYVSVGLEAETIDGRPPVILDGSFTLRKQSEISDPCA